MKNSSMLVRLSTALGLLAMSACSSAPQIAQPDAVLVNKAGNMYARARFSQASDLYRKSIEENPDSPFRKQSVLGLADSLYKDKEYVEAGLYYERFSELYPLDANTPRSFFYLAMCHYHSTHTPDRDQTNTAKAVVAFNRFLEKYPNHILSPIARNYITEMNTLIRDSGIEVARFYNRVGQNMAAIERLKEFLAKYPDSGLTEEALFMLGESYYREQAFNDAAQVFIKLIEKYPNGEFSGQAVALAQTIKLKGK